MTWEEGDAGKLMMDFSLERDRFFFFNLFIGRVITASLRFFSTHVLIVSSWKGKMHCCGRHCCHEKPWASTLYEWSQGSRKCRLEKFIHKHLKATRSQPACWNSRICLLKLVSPAVSGAIKTMFGWGVWRGTHRQGYNLALGPGSQERSPQKHQKAVEVWESSAHVLVCQENLRRRFSQHIGVWPSSRNHQQSSLPWYFKGRTLPDKSCPTLPTAHT